MKYPPQIMVQLIHIHGGLKGQIQEFPESLITIGRLPGNSLHFAADEPGVSREHARIEREGNGFKLIALNDKFGTFLNGRQVKEALLRNGDVIEFGSGGPKVSFNAEFGEPMAGPQPPPNQDPKPPAPPIREPRPPAAPVREPPPPEPRIKSVNGLPRQAQLGGGLAEAAGDAPPQSGRPVQRTSAPLTIQFGPTIRTYRELPVLLGAHAHCDFVLQHDGIFDQHAEFFYQQGSYFLKDLTGQRVLRINGKPVEAEARLSPFDEIECGPSGPAFRFLGEGRLAEIDVVRPAAPSAPGSRLNQDQPQIDPPGKKPPESFLSKLAKGFK